MPAPLTREEASQVLGVPVTADDRAVKRAYRRLAREHHPDRGGDPGTFQRLHHAYRRLADDAAPRRPLVSRGRPSRPPMPASAEAEPADVDSVAWGVGEGPSEAPLDRDRLAVLLARAGGLPVSAVIATSRAPGSRLNPIAAKLSPPFTAWLMIAPTIDDRGAATVRAELSARSRRARRILDRATLDGTWTRTRRSTSTSLSTTLAPSADRRTTAVRLTDRVAALLDALAWPLGEWTTTDEGP